MDTLVVQSTGWQKGSSGQGQSNVCGHAISLSPTGHHAIQIAIPTCKHALTAFYELSE